MPKPSPSRPAAEDGLRNEAFRVLRSNLEISLAELDRHSIIVTSPSANEGKTITAVNLAASMASTGRRVVLVDLDLRHPDLHLRLDAHNETGATDVLLGRMPLGDCLQYVATEEGNGATRGFYFLPVGPSVAHPAELLSTSRTARLVEALGTNADVVLIDAPPVLPVADTLSLARLAGGVVVVVEAGRTTYPQIERCLQLLARSQARLLGLVLNRSREDVGYGYGYPAPDET
jgi:capsular exopolysaccharide synthesis family protein